MGQVRREVFRLDDLAAFREFGVRIAGGMNDFARLPRSLLQLLLIVGGVVTGVASVIPIDFELFPSLERGERIVGNHGYPAKWLKTVRRLERIDRNRFLYADHFQSRGVVHRLHFSS